MNLVYNNNLTFKQGFEHLETLNNKKHMFFEEFVQHECTRIILTRIHDDMF